MRHCGGAAFARRRGLGDFRDFGLRHQGNIARDFSERADQQAESSRNFRETVAVCVPGQIRQAKLQIIGQRGSDRRSSITERRERAHRASKLNYEHIFLRLVEAGMMPLDCRKPTGGFQSESDGRSMLQPSAADDER